MNCDHMESVLQVFAPNVTQEIRLFKNVRGNEKLADNDFIEVIHSVHVQPNHEMVTRYNIAPFSNERATDNGLFLISRPSYNPFNQLPGNYYPVISEAVVHWSDLSLGFLTSQSMAFGNLPDAVEFMLHRRLMVSWVVFFHGGSAR